jgi:NNMT/PNMT/TEMT family protein
MTTVMPPAGSDSVFFEFPARAYLEKYYSHVGSENEAFMRSITDYLGDRSVPTDTVIEVAGGPCLYSLMAMMSRRERPFRHVTFTDIGWKNLREVEGWLHDYPQQFDYYALLKWLKERVGACPEQLVGSLRQSKWELVNFDWREPVPASWQRANDVVSCHFFAESATNDEAELVDFLGKLGRLGKPGATMLLSFMCRSEGYTIGHSDFPAFSIDEHNVFDYLERAGLELEDVELSTTPCEDPSTMPGYDALLFIGARLRD